jgi:Na+-driven multidrug efflux pump
MILAIGVVAYLIASPFAVASHVPGSEKTILWCGEVLLVISLVSLAALFFPAVRSTLRHTKQPRGLFISLAIIALYSAWAGSLLVFPPSV